MTEQTEASSTPMEILIVEDSPVATELLRRTLTKADYAVRVAKDGEEGLQAARAHRPALVMSDINMPVMNGYQLCHAIKFDDELWNIPVILLTVLSGPDDIIEAINSGADAYIVKPFVEANLLERIRSLLDAPIERRLVEERRVEVVSYSGNRHTITGGGQQILNMLFSLYENTLNQNQELTTIQAQLNLLNEDLDGQVRERTSSLAKSEERLRRAIDTARDAIITLDGESGAVTAWNPAAEAMFGYSKEETIGRVLHDFLPSNHLREAMAKGMAHFAITGEGALIGKTLELVALHKNGTEFPIEISLSATQIHGKWHATGIARDITERKRSEQAIIDSKERYHQLFENMSSGVIIYQPDTACETFTIKSINRAVERIEHLRREECLGRNVEDVFPGLRAFGLPEVLQRVCRSGETEHSPPTFYQDKRIAGWRENDVYRLDSGEIVTVYNDVTERKGHETQIARLNTTLRILSACNSALIHAQTEEKLFQDVCRNIVEIGGYQLVWVAYPSEGPDSAPVSFVHFGDEATQRIHAELALMPDHTSHCMTAAALRTRQTQLLCDNPYKRPKCDFDLLREVGVKAILALPLLHDEDILGVLTIFSPKPDVFGADEVKLMEELAADLSYGIVTLRTRTQRDQAVEGELNQSIKLRQALEQTISTIAIILEKRDPYTTGHQQRVAEIAAAIATEMGLSPQQVEGIHFGSLIHDIGKVYVPSEILNRPGKLTELELSLIKTHSQVGFDIVKDIPFPWPVAQMLYQHHERLDGSGYPQGLKGDEMMLEARILAVADVLEAMAAHRPYRAALGMEAATQELERGRGTAFDADVVDACLRLVREKGFTFTRQ